MSEIDWDKAPDGAERYSKITNAWLEKNGESIWYTRLSDGDHYKGVDQELAGVHWSTATKRPKQTPYDVDAHVSDATTDVDTTITQRGECYGKFKDGAVIMQDLKNVMRDTPNWEGLTPSQREALEMIQHKIGRILNGDPMYDDNWRDICGYSQLILDELNGVVR